VRNGSLRGSRVLGLVKGRSLIKVSRYWESVCFFLAFFFIFPLPWVFFLQFNVLVKKSETSNGFLALCNASSIVDLFSRAQSCSIFFYPPFQLRGLRGLGFFKYIVNPLMTSVFWIRESHQIMQGIQCSMAMELLVQIHGSRYN